MFPSVTIWVLRNGLSSPPPISIQRCNTKKKNALMQWSMNWWSPLFPYYNLRCCCLPARSGSRPSVLPVPPVCRSSAWGFRVTPTPAFPQRGAPALEGFSVALLALGFVLFFIFFQSFVRFGFPLLCVTCRWFLFFSSVHAARVFSQRYVELLSSSRQQSPSSHPTSPPLLLRFVWGVTCCRSFFPQALPV